MKFLTIFGYILKRYKLNVHFFQLLARDLVEHIRMVQTFATDRKAIDPIFFQLFGDIFQHSNDGQGTSSTIAEETNPFPSPEMGVVNFK